VILEVQTIDTFYGVFQALFGVSLSLDAGEVVCLLGRNGAGKTTTILSLIGLTPPRRGKVLVAGEDLTGQPPHVIARKGIGFVPEDRRIFPDLSVVENLELAGKRGRNGRHEWTVDKVLRVFPALEPLRRRNGGLLSGGEQQMLTIGRALMGNPDLLLLDEPSAGLSPLVVKMLGAQIRNLQAEGETILLAEQNADFALRLADRAYVIDKGAICYAGTAREILADERIRREYLAV
jgi:branched-chain amino acid transport system ATP-binding protein